MTSQRKSITDCDPQRADTDTTDTDTADSDRTPTSPPMTRRAAVGTLLATLGGAAIITRHKLVAARPGANDPDPELDSDPGPDAEPIWLGHM